MDDDIFRKKQKQNVLSHPQLLSDSLLTASVNSENETSGEKRKGVKKDTPFGQRVFQVSVCIQLLFHFLKRP